MEPNRTGNHVRELETNRINLLVCHDDLERKLLVAVVCSIADSSELKLKLRIFLLSPAFKDGMGNPVSLPHRG